MYKIYFRVVGWKIKNGKGDVVKECGFIICSYEIFFGEFY